MNEPSSTTPLSSSSSKRRGRRRFFEPAGMRSFDSSAVPTKAAMKSIHRSQPQQTNKRHSSTWRTGVWHAFQMISLSAVIPMVFWIRYYEMKESLEGGVGVAVLPTTMSTSLLSAAASTANTPSTHPQPPSSTTTTIHPMLQFLHNMTNPSLYPWPGDIIELQHCDFTRFQLPQFQQSYFGPLWSNWSTTTMELHLPSHTTTAQQQQEEFVGQLLEMYAMDQHWCDFNLYRPTTLAPPRPLQKMQGKLAVVIVAYRDISQLTELLDALYLPESVYFILHLDRHVDVRFQQQVQQLADTYAPYVHVVQFGTILYQTDTVTRINVQILRWMTLEWELPYDFVVLLDGAAFPLVSATELLEHILERPVGKDTEAAATTAAEQLQLHISPFRQVWLGAMTHRGRSVQSDQSVFLKRRRILFTATGTPHHVRLPRAWASTVTIPPFLQEAMQHKTHSGNVGIYSHHVIHKLLHSAQVMELLAYSKYSCCCCVEERNWVAALTLIGYQEQALKVPGSMFQLWGGETTCQGSMKNAVLARNESICYRTEDPVFQTESSSSSSLGFTPIQQQPHYIQGDELWDELVLARQRGYLFARKFSSDSMESVQLMNEIKEYMWDSD